MLGEVDARCLLKEPKRLRGSRCASRLRTRLEQIVLGLPEVFGPRVVVGQHAVVVRQALAEERLYRLGDSSVEGQPRLLCRPFVDRFLDECVGEDVLALALHGLAFDDLPSDEPAQIPFELAGLAAGHRVDHPIREALPDHGGYLHEVLRARGQPLDARHDEFLDRPRDGTQRVLQRLHVPEALRVVFHQRADHLFQVERVAARALADQHAHRLRQVVDLHEVLEQLVALLSSEGIEPHLDQPRGKLRPRRLQHRPSVLQLICAGDQHDKDGRLEHEAKERMQQLR